ncbi:uncharacterized protein BDZ99DRAFT_498337 [Mytilinidion resinicola]|uniref:UBA domain-containing protein n=1 Tax=Mytilinidion resinicola TaxID=574789 RepID=A0A6A6YQ46_9PEZI|nr:uncharacterized protein BDZ99DRAFT_498337 [Mytilinidion resinicola]KAF2810144.1 hypothetical protein BDZ99DRAFT_498337 [Mytilinidion resinicola]
MAPEAPSLDISSSSLKHRSLSFFTKRESTPASVARQVSMRGPTFHHSLRWKSSKKRDAKNTATVLRAVPEADAPSAPLPQRAERDAAPSPNDEILHAIGRLQPSPDSTSRPNTPHSSRTSSSRAPSVTSSPFSPTRSRRDKVSPFPSPKVGVWKDGKAHWDSAPSIPLIANASDAFAGLEATPITDQAPAEKKNRRPRIQVIIPNDQRAMPFPALAFFSQNNNIPHYDATEVVSGVSPPSGSRKLPLRTSVVSPLMTNMPKPARPSTDPSSHLAIAEEQPEDSGPGHRPLPSMSTSDEDSQIGDDDASSNYSKHSSRTSMDSDSSPREVKPISLHSRSGSVVFSIHSPVAAGVFDDDASIAQRTAPRESSTQDVEVCLQVPMIEESPILGLHYQHPTPRKGQKAYDVLGISRPQRGTSTASLSTCRHSGIQRRTSSCGLSRRSNTSLRRKELLERSLTKRLPPTPPSPTLSEAEHDLEHHLTAINDDSPYSPFGLDQAVNRTVEVEGDDLYAHPAPVVPRRSSKRNTILSPTMLSASRCPPTYIASQYQQPTGSLSPPVPTDGLKRSWSKGRGQNLTVAIPEAAKRLTSDFTFSPIPIPEPAHNADRNISPEVAEGVILSILQNLESLDDLFATAVVNKGFYRVFKRHELSLMKSALRNMSPPAWEHREICPPDSEEQDLETPKQVDYTPTSYLQYYIRDMYIIAALKSLILDQCQSFLRPETAAALASNDQVISSGLDDTFWRIWSFCKLFGSGKGREDDVVAQMDWLKGGLLVHQNGCRGTIFSTHSTDASSILATAPEHFAKGNEGGLTTEQLYDMTELWNCLGVLLQGFEGRTEQAREYGVYESTEVRGGDVDGEEFMLEEWYHYLLTLGLSTILDLATPSKLPDASLFVLASENGWVNWKAPQHGGSRKTFLKEAVSRVYEDKIAASFSSQGQKEMIRQLSKQRIQKHILEIRKRKMTGEIREVRMSQERPMSNWESVFTRFAGPQPPASRAPSMSSPLSARSPLAPVPETSHSGFVNLVPPPLENHPAFLQHPLQQQINQSSSAENTAEKAIYRIVEMGFTADQARHALRMTDMGDGLRVDRAVELLLRA